MKFLFNEIAKIVPLSWISEPNDVTVNANQGLKIECKANGLPKPTIKWISSKGFVLIIKSKKKFLNLVFIFRRYI
jgi:hypothetical protein